MVNKKQKIISIAGMTATGKSSLAVKIAEKIGGEIISADSRQIYRGFDIATAKISASDMKGIKHYLISILEPWEEFSAGIFVDLAKNAIKGVVAKNKIPIIAGGTGLYLKMLLDGVDAPKSKPDKILRADLEAKNSDELYMELCKLDSEFAKSIHPNDKYKIIRSIEILTHSNTTMEKSRGRKEKEFDVLKIVLSAKDRQVIYDRINARVELMIKKGLEREAKNIYEKYPDLKLFNSTIGYQEFVPYFKNEIGLDEVIEKIKQNTRRYAKRQMTWFKAQENVHWFNIDELSIEQIENEVLKLYEKFLAGG